MHYEKGKLEGEIWRLDNEEAGRMDIPDQPCVLPELFESDLIQENIQALSQV